MGRTEYGRMSALKGLKEEKVSSKETEKKAKTQEESRSPGKIDLSEGGSAMCGEMSLSCLVGPEI